MAQPRDRVRWQVCSAIRRRQRWFDRGLETELLGLVGNARRRNDGRGNHDANAQRLIALNLATREEKIIAQDPQYDVGGIMIQPITRVIQAVSFYKDKQEWHVVDSSIAEDFEG